MSLDEIKLILRYNSDISKRLPKDYQPSSYIWDKKPKSEYIINDKYSDSLPRFMGDNDNSASRIPISHIYDGYLSAMYGGTIGTSNACIKYFSDVFKYYDITFDLKLLIETSMPKLNIGIASFISLYAFLLDESKKNTYIYFGPPAHATALYLNKTDKFIKITYINTGEGSRDDIMIKDENEQYYKIFNSIYLPHDANIIKAFMHYLKPFLIYRYVEIKEKEKYDIIMKLSYINFPSIHLDVDIDTMNIEQEPRYFNIFNKKYSDINKYYNDFYDNIINENNRDAYYNLLISLFDNITQGEINRNFPHLENDINIYERELGERYEKFTQDWNTMYEQEINRTIVDDNIDVFLGSDEIANYNFYVNYRKFALNSFIHKLGPNKMIYFAFQKSGTCVFKSCMATLFLHIITNYSDVNFCEIYLWFTQKMLTSLNDDIERYKENIVDHTPDTMIIYNKLVSDGIIDIKYKPYNLIKENKKISLTFSGVEGDIKTYYCGPPINDLNMIIHAIRNKDASIKSKIMASYKNIDLKKSLDDSTYQGGKELKLLAILWEYYFNFDKWNDTFKEIDYVFNTYNDAFKIFEIMTVRFMLNIDELIWIYKINLRYCFQNATNPLFIYNRMWKEFELLKHFNINYNDREASLAVDRQDEKKNLQRIQELLYRVSTYDYYVDSNNEQIQIDDIVEEGNMSTSREQIIYGKMSNDALSHFVINNLIYKIDLPNEEIYTHLRNEYNMIKPHINNMYNMLPHILNIFKRNSELYNELSFPNIYNYIKTFLMFYQYFNLNMRLKIVKSILKQFNNVVKINIDMIKKILSSDVAEVSFINNNDNTSENKSAIEVLFNKVSNLLNTLTDEYYLIETTGNSMTHMHLNYINGDIEVESLRLDINYNTLDNLVEMIDNVQDENQIDGFLLQVINKFKFNLTHKSINITENIIEYKYGNEIIKSKYNIPNITCPLLLYLQPRDKQSVKYLITNKHLIMIINKYEYNYPFSDNILFIFNVTMKTERYRNYFEISYDNIMINGNLYNYTEDYKKYPFLINLPLNCLNFVSVIDGDNIYYNNTYKVLSFYNEKYGPHFLANAVNPPQLIPPPPEYGEFIVNSNMLTLIYDDLNKAYLEKVRIPKKGEFIYTNIEPNNMDIYMCEDMIEYKPITFNKLEELFKRGEEAVNSIYNSIIMNVKEERKDFVDWLSPFINKFTEKDEDNNTFENCNTHCEHKPSPEVRRNIINGLLLLRSKIIKEIIYVDNHINSVMQFIKYNNHILSLLLQVNNILNNMIRLNKAVDNCSNLTCHDIYELNEIFNIRKDTMDTFEMIIETVFGRVLRQEQLDRYYDMIGDYKKGQRSVYQFMMGKGKSSIVTPMLYYNLTRYGEKVYIVVPTHLVKQTIATYYNFSQYLNNTPEVMTDADLKLKFLERTYDRNAIYLFDEFDSMYNPLQSNFNIIRKMMLSLRKDEINNIFKIAYNYLANNITPPLTKYSREEDIISILSNPSFIKNVSYGMSTINMKSRICIPYSRQDSPAEGSSFSSYMITLLLTINFFYHERNFKIYNEDLEYMLNTNKNLLRELIEFIYEGKPYPFTPTTTLKEKITLMKQSFTEYIIPTELFIKYLYVFAEEIKRTGEIMNCSFIDIMMMPCVWQVGYSGTVKMDMKIPPIDDNKLHHYNTTISEDPDEHKNVFTALHRYKNIQNLKPIKKDIDAVLNKVLHKDLKLDVIIDACALFKDYPNHIIAENIHKKTGRQVVFLTKNDDMMLYNNTGMTKFSYGALNNPIYYFSQRHTVGIDIMNQPTSLKGIVLVDDNNTYTQVSQAIYRMRKLNKGQTIMIGYTGDKDYTLSKDIYKMINDKENEYQEGYEPLLYLQYLKYYYRSSVQTNDNSQYVEKDLGLIYDAVRQDEMRHLDLMIVRRLLRNVFNIDSTDINTINKFRQNKALDSCIKFIFSKPQDKLLELLYNVNTFTINVNMQEDQQQDIEEDQERQRLRILNKNINIITSSHYFNLTYMIYNPFKTLDEYKRLYSITHTPIQNGEYTIFMPYNNIKYSLWESSKDTISKYFIVMINPNNYIIESSRMLDYYINIFPLYTLAGDIINDISFTRSPHTINVNNILNFTISFAGPEYGEEPINHFAALFNVIDGDINDIIVDEPSFIIYSMIFAFMQLSLTDIAHCKNHINIITDNLYNKTNTEYLLIFGETKKKLIGEYSEYIKSYYGGLEFAKPLATVSQVKKGKINSKFLNIMDTYNINSRDDFNYNMIKIYTA